MHVLLEHEWRGNVRELENLIERVVAFSVGAPVTDAGYPRVAPPYRGASNSKAFRQTYRTMGWILKASSTASKKICF